MNYAAVLHRRFTHDGDEWVYVTPSASLLRLDEVSGAVLDHFSTPGGRDPSTWPMRGGENGEESAETFRDMVAMGIIRPLGEPSPPAQELPPMPYPLATLVLNVTNKCNLSCTYCYEYGEDRIADEAAARRAPLMTVETARRSIDFFLENAKGRGKVGITFFGGETLLNLAAIKAAVEYAEERAREGGLSISFALTTNATLLTEEVIAFLAAHRFGINVSIDGDRAAQDRHRTTKDGAGTYDRIAPQIRKLIAAMRSTPGARPVGARVTLTKGGAASIVQTHRHLAEELGFHEVGFAPVTSANNRDYALSGDDYEDILRGFHALAQDYVAAAKRGEHHGFSNLNDLLREIHQGVNKAHPCGAGLGLVGVSTDGEVALCHRFVESGAHAIGHVDSGLDEEKRSSFLRRGHVSKKVACNECWARPMCAGGCYHEAYVRYADASQPNLHYCDWIRAWTDLGLETYATIMAANPSFFDRFEDEFVMET